SIPASILVSDGRFPENPSPPSHLLVRRASELLVVPIIRFERAIGVLTVVGRDKPLTDLDHRFIRLFGNYLVDLIFNILLRKKHIDKLIKKATHDSLTGLLNRGAITEHLEKYIELSARTNTPITVLIADLDHFKYVNDTFGHLVGDIVLKEVARRLQKCSRSSDYLGRYGGEEFILVLYPCNEEQARIAAERFRTAIANKPVEGNNLTIPITISIGTASATGRIKSETLIKLADEALYISKKNGRNRITTLQVESEKKSYGEE
ncbi:MAG: GGDEF domain-containing protein, partial [Chitinispirillaceae bacterium]|nr:GGDEF domain-containing protein [Chitinispirillaceae bacterium]